MQYFVLPHCMVAINPRVASQAIAQAIMQTYYPMFTKNLSSSAEYWHAAPKTDEPAGTVLMLVRDPVDRFLSAVSGAEITVKEAVSRLAGSKDEHFTKQSLSKDTVTQLFKYPDEMPEFCEAAGLPTLAAVNETTTPKASLSAAQLNSVKQYYADDTKMFTDL